MGDQSIAEINTKLISKLENTIMKLGNLAESSEEQRFNDTVDIIINMAEVARLGVEKRQLRGDLPYDNNDSKNTYLKALDEWSRHYTRTKYDHATIAEAIKEKTGIEILSDYLNPSKPI